MGRYLVPGWRMGWITIHDRNGVFSQEIRNGLSGLSQKMTCGSSAIVQGALGTILNTTPAEFFRDTIDQVYVSLLFPSISIISITWAVHQLSLHNESTFSLFGIIKYSKYLFFCFLDDSSNEWWATSLVIERTESAASIVDLFVGDSDGQHKKWRKLNYLDPFTVQCPIGLPPAEWFARAEAHHAGRRHVHDGEMISFVGRKRANLHAQPYQPLSGRRWHDQVSGIRQRHAVRGEPGHRAVRLLPPRSGESFFAKIVWRTSSRTVCFISNLTSYRKLFVYLTTSKLTT